MVGTLDLNQIVRELKGVLDQLGYLSPQEDAQQAERTIKGIIERLKASPQTPSAKATTRTTPKPCWAAANRVYEWGIKQLPPSHHNYRDIHQAAGEQADAPRVRIPTDAATFGLYVRRYRRTMGLKSHRRTRSSMV